MANFICISGALQALPSVARLKCQLAKSLQGALHIYIWPEDGPGMDGIVYGQLAKPDWLIYGVRGTCFIVFYLSLYIS